MNFDTNIVKHPVYTTPYSLCGPSYGREARVEVGDCAHADLVVNGFPAPWSGLPRAWQVIRAECRGGRSHELQRGAPPPARDITVPSNLALSTWNIITNQWPTSRNKTAKLAEISQRNSRVESLRQRIFVFKSYEIAFYCYSLAPTETKITTNNKISTMRWGSYTFITDWGITKVFQAHHMFCLRVNINMRCRTLLGRI